MVTRTYRADELEAVRCKQCNVRLNDLLTPEAFIADSGDPFCSFRCRDVYEKGLTIH